MTGFNSKREAVADKQHWNEDEWRRNNWRCGHGWLRGEQCEICNAAQEPVAEIVSDVNGFLSTRWNDNWTPNEGNKLYTHPPQREWVGLTEQEIDGITKVPTLTHGILIKLADVKAALQKALAQPAQERNFCSRCGKRTADLTVIHTCTPPQGSA